MLQQEVITELQLAINKIIFYINQKKSFLHFFAAWKSFCTGFIERHVL